MNDPQRKPLAVQRNLSRVLAASFRQLLEDKYSRIFSTARQEWQQRFGGSDPSDACVSVRISGSFTPKLRNAA